VLTGECDVGECFGDTDSILEGRSWCSKLAMLAPPMLIRGSPTASLLSACSQRRCLATIARSEDKLAFHRVTQLKIHAGMRQQWVHDYLKVTSTFK
jgi:hypothetical protein